MASKLIVTYHHPLTSICFLWTLLYLYLYIENGLVLVQDDEFTGNFNFQYEPFLKHKYNKVYKKQMEVSGWWYVTMILLATLTFKVTHFEI